MGVMVASTLAVNSLTLEGFFVCPSCGGALTWAEEECRCDACRLVAPIVDGLPRFVRDGAQESFSLQWNRFWDVQLDSRNGTTLSRDRLLEQSRLTRDDFRGKLVLEVGCGAGRFTEVLLAFGAKVIATDYSAAVDACARTNSAARQSATLLTAQADVFHLPLRQEFDIVLGYGMLQHTGNPRRALECLWSRVKPGGVLLVDRYAADLRQGSPLKYAMRPFTRRIPATTLLEAIEAFCRRAVPVERAILSRIQGNGLQRFVRYVVNRSPNSVYPINLEIEGKIDHDVAFRWSVLDTFDQYAPLYDRPCTESQWKRELTRLKFGAVERIGRSGQGHVGVVRRVLE